MAAMQGLCVITRNSIDHARIAEHAVKCADALIKELNKKK
jgi:hypothetical protein